VAEDLAVLRERDVHELVRRVAGAEVHELRALVGGHGVARLGQQDGLFEALPFERKYSVDESRGGGHCGSPAAGTTLSFSIATVAFLNSGIFEDGSTAVLVSELARPGPPQWKGTNTVSRRIERTKRAFSTARPRRVRRLTQSPSPMPKVAASAGWISTYGSG